MHKYLPHVTLAVQVLLVIMADKYFGISDMAIAKVRSATGG
jgi:hypothetical protein